jgi:hypothetical protein
MDMDALTACATALGSYLAEIEDYRATCLRYEAGTSMDLVSGCLRFTRAFPWSAAAAAHVTRTAQRLPEWERSPFWESDRDSWLALERQAVAQAGASAAPPGLLIRGVSWEGRPVLVCASSVSDRLLLTGILPPVGAGLPELPLRVVAQGLACLADLLPDGVARPLPATVKRGRKEPWTVRDYLARATPQNLCAGQCFSDDSAAQSLARQASAARA